MKRCEFCGTNLPVHANFCVICGRPFARGTLADHTFQQALATPAPNTSPLLSSLLYPIIMNAETSPRDTDVSVRNRWVEWGMTSNSPQFPERRTDKSGAVLPDLLVPRMLAMQGPASSKGQAPMVPGTTQGGGVSPVPGSTPPPTPNRPQDTGVSAPPQTTALAQQSRPKQPLYHFEPPVHHPIYLPQPTPSRPTPESEHHHPGLCMHSDHILLDCMAQPPLPRG